MEYFNELNNLTFLKIDSSILNEYVEFINQNNVRGVGINLAWGYNEKDLIFLEKCQNVEMVTIVDTGIDISAIKYLSNLKFLSTNSNPISSIDLSEFSCLEELRIDHHKNFKNLDKLSSLKRLHISKFNADDLTGLEGLINLEELVVTGGKLTSLKGLDNFTKLVSFKGIRLNKLTQLGLSKNITSLIDFRLNKCKKISNYESIVVMKNIETLYLVDCGVIKDLNFVSELKRLKEIRFPFTDIEDGNVELLQNIDRFYFTNKKHFSHSYEDLIQLAN